MSRRKKGNDDYVLWDGVAASVELYQQLYNVRFAFNRDVVVRVVVRESGICLIGCEGSEDVETPAPPVMKSDKKSFSSSHLNKPKDKEGFDYVG